MYALLKNMPQIPEEKMNEIFSDRSVSFINVVKVKEGTGSRIISGIPLIITDICEDVEEDSELGLLFMDLYTDTNNKYGNIYSYGGVGLQDSGKESTVDSVCKSLEDYLQSIGHLDYEIVKSGESIDE